MLDNTLSSFELERLENIRRNQEFLAKLGLASSASPSPSTSSSASPTTARSSRRSSKRTRGAGDSDDEDGGDADDASDASTSKAKKQKKPKRESNTGPTRRSLRIARSNSSGGGEGGGDAEVLKALGLDGLEGDVRGSIKVEAGRTYKTGTVLMVETVEGRGWEDEEDDEHAGANDEEGVKEEGKENEVGNGVGKGTQKRVEEVCRLLDEKTRGSKEAKREEQEDEKDDTLDDLIRDLHSLRILGNRSVKVVKDRVLSLSWHPSTTKHILIAGDKMGRLGFWDVPVDGEEIDENDNNKTYEFKPHDGGISTLIHDPIDSTKLYTASYDGSIRRMDVNAMAFEEILQFPDRDMVTSMDFKPSSASLVGYCTNSAGELVRFDPRSSGLSSLSTTSSSPSSSSSSSCLSNSSTRSWSLSTSKLTCIHINPTHPHHFLTSGLDRHLRIWDDRTANFSSPSSSSTSPGKPLWALEHGKSCSSAYWDAKGEKIVTTSYDDTLRVVGWTPKTSHSPSKSSSGTGTLTARIRHNNQTGRWVTNFRARWMVMPSLSPSASFSFTSAENLIIVPNMDRKIDIYDAGRGSLVTRIGDTTTGGVVTAIP
ncbi:hypothetical protein HK102_005870, partial [Quaeritorhiza haematococci]